MAKRRRKATVRRVRAKSRAPKLRTYGKRRKTTNKGILGIALGGFAYGGLREFASEKLAGLTKGMSIGFLGKYSDEVTMGILSYFLAKGKIPLLNKVPYSREIGKAGLYIESARMGSEIVSPMLNKQTKTTSYGNSIR